MSEIRFYHLEQQKLEQALPALLTKALQGGHKILVKTDDEASASNLSDALWVSSPSSFIPHGTKKDDFSEEQPIYITAGADNPNNADVLILVGSSELPLDGFSMCCKMFDGNNAEALQTARRLWKELKDQNNHELTYWQQGASGWEKKQ